MTSKSAIIIIFAVVEPVKSLRVSLFRKFFYYVIAYLTNTGLTYYTMVNVWGEIGSIKSTIYGLY